MTAMPFSSFAPMPERTVISASSDPSSEAFKIRFSSWPLALPPPKFPDRPDALVVLRCDFGLHLSNGKFFADPRQSVEPDDDGRSRRLKGSTVRPKKSSRIFTFPARAPRLDLIAATQRPVLHDRAHLEAAAGIAARFQNITRRLGEPDRTTVLPYPPTRAEDRAGHQPPRPFSRRRPGSSPVRHILREKHFLAMSSFFALSILPPVLSILLIATTNGVLASANILIASFVCGLTPSSAAMTRIAKSAACAPRERMAVNASCPGRINKSNFAAASFDLVCSDCLRDAACFPRGNARFPDVVQKRRLAMVNVRPSRRRSAVSHFSRHFFAAHLT